MRTRRSKAKKLSYNRAGQPWNTKEKRSAKAAVKPALASNTTIEAIIETTPSFTPNEIATILDETASEVDTGTMQVLTNEEAHEHIERSIQ
jgi:hypothetical protein